MRTTLELDRELLERARNVLGARSFTEAIETALRRAVEQSDAQAAWQALDRSGLSWKSIDDLLAHRRGDGARALR